MRITILDDVFEWPNYASFRDSFTIAEEGDMEEWAGELWESAYRSFWGGGRKAARAIFFCLYQRHHPDASWSDLESLTAKDWSIETSPSDAGKAAEPVVPTSAPEGADASASSDSSTSTDS